MRKKETTETKMDDEELMDTKVLLSFGYNLKMVIPMRTATRIMAILSQENVLKADSNYSSGKSVNTLVPWGTDEVTISMISPAEILLRCAAGETK